MNKNLEAIYSVVEEYFHIGVEFLVLIIEIIGTFVLMYAVISALIGFLKKDEHARLNLAEGIAFALGFKVGGELLRTVIVRNWEEMLILGSIILLRAALTFLIQWEIRIEKRNQSLLPAKPKDKKENKE